MRGSIITAVVLATVVVALAGGTARAASNADIGQAQAAGWNCNPLVPIGGYLHCASPGKPSLAELIGGGVTAPSLVLRAYFPDGAFAGIESLLRADLLAGHVPKCPQDSLPEWGFLPFGYYACHRFAT